MGNYILLILSFFFYETVGQSQKSLVTYDDQLIRIKYFINRDKDKEYRRNNDDVHFKLKIVDTRLKDLTNEEIENAFVVEFIDSAGRKVQSSILAFAHYSKRRDVGDANEMSNLKPKIGLSESESLFDITIPIRRRVKTTWGEVTIGYHFPVGRCDMRITVLVGKEKQELLIPLIIR